MRTAGWIVAFVAAVVLGLMMVDPVRGWLVAAVFLLGLVAGYFAGERRALDWMDGRES